MVDPGVLEAFGQQITSMNDEYGSANIFSSPRYEGSKKVSTVFWATCQPVPTAGCGPEASCCEVFDDGTKRTCGVFDKSSSAFLFDRFLSFSRNGISLIAGITLKYNGSGVTVPSNSFGVAPLPGVARSNLCFVLDLKCDPVTRYFQLPQIDALRVGEDICLRARVESQHGCVTSAGKYLDLTSWKILFYLIAPLAIGAGLLLCFLGWRLFRVTSLVLGMFFGLSIAGIVILFSVFLACEATKPSWVQLDFWNWSHECTFHYLTANAYVGWIASISGLLFGLILAVTAYRKPSFGGVLIGMCGGAWMSDLLYVTTFSVLRQHWIVLLLSALFIPLFAILGGCLPNSWKRSFFILLISFTGGYLVCWGMGAYTSFFPSVMMLEELGPKWQYIVFAIVISVLGVVGSVIQFNVTGSFDWDTLMESGLCPGKSAKRRGGRATTQTLLSSDQEVEMEPQVKAILKQISDVNE